MRPALIVCAAAALLVAADSASACESCLRTGVNFHLSPINSGSGPTPSSSSTVTSPAYSSRPGAAVTLFMDLDGIDYQGTWAGREPGVVPAYDIDGDPTTFSEQELQNIRQIWTRVAEAYSPFDVNVTTVDPGSFTQVRVNTRVIIGGSNAWYSSGAGGVAYVGGFAYGEGNEQWRTGWAFPDNLGGGFPKYVSDATIHEFGHQFGLAHQAEFDENGNLTNGYRRSEDGGLTAPHMGVAYGAVRGLWSDGPRSSGGDPVQQLDLDILTSLEDDTVNYPWNGYWNGFGFRPDDWGDDLASASMMFQHEGILHTFGVIEQNTDVDMFYFYGRGGEVQITADGAEFGQMLDIVLSLFDSSGELIYTDNPSLSLVAAEGYGLDASFDGILAEGDYYLSISSNGGYGDIGQFFVTVSGAVSVPEPAAGVLLVLGSALLLRRRLR